MFCVYLSLSEHPSPKLLLSGLQQRKHHNNFIAQETSHLLKFPFKDTFLVLVFAEPMYTIPRPSLGWQRHTVIFIIRPSVFSSLLFDRAASLATDTNKILLRLSHILNWPTTYFTNLYTKTKKANPFLLLRRLLSKVLFKLPRQKKTRALWTTELSDWFVIHT